MFFYRNLFREILYRMVKTASKSIWWFSRLTVTSKNRGLCFILCRDIAAGGELSLYSTVKHEEPQNEHIQPVPGYISFKHPHWVVHDYMRVVFCTPPESQKGFRVLSQFCSQNLHLRDLFKLFRDAHIFLDWLQGSDIIL